MFAAHFRNESRLFVRFSLFPVTYLHRSNSFRFYKIIYSFCTFPGIIIVVGQHLLRSCVQSNNSSGLITFKIVE